MLQLQNVTFSYQEKILFHQFNLDIHAKDKIAIIGPSGCGKTTLLHLISGTLRLKKGKILYNGQNIYTFNHKQRKNYQKNIICYLSQQLLLFENLTVYENLFLFFKKEAIDDILTQTNLLSLKHKKIKTLSGGEKQKIAILKACLSSNEIFLFDEITHALDLKTAQEVLHFLFSLLHDKTIIIVTHQLTLVEPYLSKIYDVSKKQLKVLNQKSLTPFMIKKENFQNKQYHIHKHECKKAFQKPFFFISLFCILFLTSFSFCRLSSFTQSYQEMIQNNLNQYFDHNVLKIMNYQALKDDHLNLNVQEDLENFTNQLQVECNGNAITYFYFKPVQNLKSILMINQLFFENNFIKKKNENSISLIYKEYKWDFRSIPIIQENAIFSKPCIYYDYDYFLNLLQSQKDNQGNSWYETMILNQSNNTKIVFLNSDFLIFYKKEKNHFLFQNHLLSFQHQADESYFHSDALLDFFTNQLLYQSCKDLLRFFFLFCTISCLGGLYFLIQSFLLHTIKKIAIYRQMGASYFECFFSFFIMNLISIFLLIISNSIFFHFNFIYLGFSILILIFIQFSMILHSIYQFEKKDLISFLKEDFSC